MKFQGLNRFLRILFQQHYIYHYLVLQSDSNLKPIDWKKGTSVGDIQVKMNEILELAHDKDV